MKQNIKMNSLRLRLKDDNITQASEYWLSSRSNINVKYKGTHNKYAFTSLRYSPKPQSQLLPNHLHHYPLELLLKPSAWIAIEQYLVNIFKNVIISLTLLPWLDLSEKMPSRLSFYPPVSAAV